MTTESQTPRRQSILTLSGGDKIDLAETVEEIVAEMARVQQDVTRAGMAALTRAGGEAIVIATRHIVYIKPATPIYALDTDVP